jgi:[NiFe] hydrogenase diaphorase moiety large subunit
VVNNVETLCCVPKILEEGPATFGGHGSQGSSGTKLLSISGDCLRPGIYEVEFGIALSEVLRLAGADDAIAVQVGGPSGQLIGPKDYARKICFDDLATGGSIMTFGPGRDVLKTAACFMDFFVDESCGYCTPCRVGNVLLKERLERIRSGRGEPGDLEYLSRLGTTVKTASRCGLGQTSANPILTSLANFRPRYEAMVKANPDGFNSSFDVREAVSQAEGIAGHASVIYPQAIEER